MSAAPGACRPGRCRRIGPEKGVEFVLDHCIDKFRERAYPNRPKDRKTDEWCVTKLRRWLRRARPVVLKPWKVQSKLSNNAGREAKYWLYGDIRRDKGFIMVVEDNVLVTVHLNQSGEWMFEGTDLSLFGMDRVPQEVESTPSDGNN